MISLADQNGRTLRSEVAVYLLYHLTTVTQTNINLPPRPWVKGYSRPGNSAEQDRLCTQGIAIAPVFFPSKDNLLPTLLRQSQSRKTQQPCVPLHHPPSPTMSLQVALEFQILLPSFRHTALLLISVYSQALPLNCCVCVIQNHCLHAQDTSLSITKAGP